MSDTYITLTPFGRVDAIFGGEAGVALRGPDDAVAHVLRTMNEVTGTDGVTLTVDSVDEHDYLHFCQPDGSRVRIIPPARVALLDDADGDDDGSTEDEADEDDGTDPEAEFEAAPDDEGDVEALDAAFVAAAALLPTMARFDSAGDVRAAITHLRIALDVALNNEPINRAEGNIEQADLELASAGQFKHAISILAKRPVLDSADVSRLLLDGDFTGHPFRGNQYRKASKESGAAVSASIKAKRAETRGGDAKAQKSAHRGAHHAHMAAAEGATGKARNYHRKMAKFHGSRAGVRLDSVALDRASPGPDAEPVLVNKFESGDKVVCLDDDADYTVTGQRGAMVSVKGSPKALHANRLKLASGKKPERVALDGVDHDWHRRTQERFRDYNDEQLKFVIKDAREAEELGRKMNPSNPRLGQYLDEISYASMELQRRKKGGKKGDKFDSAAEVPGLRVAFSQAGSTSARLALAWKIITARGTTGNTTVSGIDRATPEALTLMQLAQAGGGVRNAYKAALAIELAIDAQQFEGVSIRWSAVPDVEVPAFDAVGDLFGDNEVGTQSSYLRGAVAYKGRTFASIYVRGDGSAAVVPNDRMSGLDHWESKVDEVAESLGGWVDGEADADAIAEAVAGPRGSAPSDPGSLAGVLENSDGLKGGELPDPDDPDYAGDKDPAPTHGQRELAVTDALQDEGWKIHSLVASKDGEGERTIVEAEYEDYDASGPGITWQIVKTSDDDRKMTKALADNPDVDAKTMAELIIMEANALVMQAEQSDLQKLSALEAAMPRDDIRSDDPQLIPKLQAKLAALTARQELMRKANKLLRAGKDAGLRAMGFRDDQIAALKVPDFAGRPGFPDYKLSNNNGVIAATRKRLDAALKAAGAGGSTPGGVDRKAAEGVYESLYYYVDSLSGSSDTERMRPEVESTMVERIAALQALVTGGQWPARSPMDPQRLLERADSVLQGIRALKAAGGPEWVGRGDARSYYVTTAAGLTQEQIEAILAKPDEVTRSGTIDVPRYKVANLLAAIEAAKAGPAPEPFDHNGRLIYPTAVGGQARWAVQTDENKGTDRRMGDTLHPTREEAIKEADRMDASAAAAAERARMAAEEARLQAAAAANMADIDGFGDSMGALARGAAQAALWQVQRFNGQQMSRRDFIRQAAADGATVAPHPADVRRITFAGGGYMTQKDIGKTAMDYAEFLIGKKGGGTPAPKPTESPTEVRQRGYDSAVKDLRSIHVRGGAVAAMDLATSRLASTTLARDFGQSVEDFEAADPFMAGKRQAYRDWKDGKLTGDAPRPDPTPPVDPQRAADIAILQQIADGTHPDMLAPETADLIEAALLRYPGDAEVDALGERAVTAYSNGLMAATT